MKEPRATQVVSAFAALFFAGFAMAAYMLIYGFGLTVALWGALLGACGFLLGLCMARIEYGEWMQFRPWWDRSPPQPPDFPPG